MERVLRGGMRPSIPRAAPPRLAALLTACWVTDPAQRPAFSQIIGELEALLASLSPQAGGGGGSGGGGGGAPAGAGAPPPLPPLAVPLSLPPAAPPGGMDMVPSAYASTEYDPTESTPGLKSGAAGDPN
jgi:hypothetical protein